MASTLNNIVNCLINMHQFNDVLIHFNQSLEIKKKMSLNPKKTVKQRPFSITFCIVRRKCVTLIENLSKFLPFM